MGNLGFFLGLSQMWGSWHFRRVSPPSPCSASPTTSVNTASGGIFALAHSVGIAMFPSEDSLRNHSHFICTTTVLVALLCFLALIISWTYVSAISLSASILFHLVCNLQVIQFDDYGKLLQREGDVLVLMEEHIRLRYHLSKISHMFRIYLLLEFLVVTASQCVTLLQVTGYGGILTFINGGDFAVSILVQVVGIIICLHAATRISHRAQGVVSLASRWYALVTCTSSDASQLRSSASAGSLEAANHLNSILLVHS